MTKFVYVYHGGAVPQTPEEGEKVMAAWVAWFGTLGKAVVDAGAPFGKSTTVSVKGTADNGGSNPASGYSIIDAADMEAASVLAKGCPILEGGAGTVEIAEILPM